MATSDSKQPPTASKHQRHVESIEMEQGQNDFLTSWKRTLRTTKNSSPTLLRMLRRFGLDMESFANPSAFRDMGMGMGGNHLT